MKFATGGFLWQDTASMDAAESQQLHQENRRLTDENQQLRGQVASLNKKVASLQKQLDDLHNQHKQLLDRMAGRASLDHQQLRETIRGSPVVYADETSWYVGDDGGGTRGSNWLWTFTTPVATWYQVAQVHRSSSAGDCGSP